jgi:hypothetical protein
MTGPISRGSSWSGHAGSWTRTCSDCLVEQFEPLIAGLDLPDPGDRHVLAAAIRGRADVIVTRNLRDFPPDRLAPYGIEAQHPDTFEFIPIYDMMRL